MLFDLYLNVRPETNVCACFPAVNCFVPTLEPTPTIVRADPSHLEQLTPLFDAYRVFYGQASDSEAARDFLAARLRLDESVIFLALLDRKAAGFTQLYGSFSSVSLGRLWILNDLFVAPEARRKAVAGALLGRAHDHARETGAQGLTLQTATDNSSAQALYEAHGWEQDAVLTYSRRA